MIARLLLSIITCGSIIATARATESAPDSPRARAARYYAAGLEQPLLEMRRGALLLQACVTRLRGACSKEQRTLAANSRAIELLDELTLFPQRPADDPTAGVTRASVLKDRIADAGAALMRAAGAYDHALIARYGAALRVCPGDSDARYRESLEALTATDLRRFQGLDGAAYDAARASISDAEDAAAEALRKVPGDECEAVLTVGQLLMEMMNGKLEPWTRENARAGNARPEFDFDAARKPPPDPAPTRDVAVSIAGNFVTLVATELQLQVFPDTAPRIKAIAVAEGIGPG